MKHSGILAAAMIVLGSCASAQAAAPQRVTLICNNDGRCVQQHTAQRAPRLQRYARDTHTRRHQAHARRRVLIDANVNAGSLITVSTAAGIDIRVAVDFATKIQGFIADLKARGYQPRHIGCYSWAASHVANSLHHTGEACDFDQRGWGRTAAAMYHVADLVQKWGLRNGCSFGDCGHIDSGRRMAGARKPWPRLVELAQHP